MSDIEFTGERFVPGVPGEIAHEHWHRYAFARRFVAGRRTLDVACGEGYGSALLASAAATVVGVDVAPEVVAHAAQRYRDRSNLRFEAGSASRLPLADASVDAVVSFETIEHLPREDQPRMIAEIARVLVDDGLLILSAPNPVEYSQKRGYRNPFHIHEPDRAEIDEMLAQWFRVRRWHRQRRYFGSALWCEGAGAADFEAWQGSEAGAVPAPLPEAMYALVVAARRDGVDLPRSPSVSLFSDGTESELVRMDANAAEVLRLDRLLAQPDTATPRGLRDKALIELLYATGLRVTELLSLKPADVNLDAGYLTCIGKGDKQRIVPLGHAAADWVRRYLAPWVGRRLRGASSGDGLSPKHLELVDVVPVMPAAPE